MRSGARSHSRFDDPESPVTVDRPDLDLNLAGQRIHLRALRPGDRPALRAILAQPETAAWWDTADPDMAVDEWLGGGGGSVGFALELDARVIGSIQYAEENEPGYRHVGIDLFLDADQRGR